MEFTLSYQGNIQTENHNKQKHDLRLEFHRQLIELMKLPPLKFHKDWFEPPFPDELHKNIDGKDFICLVSQKLNMYVELKINVFSVYKNRGFKDIDNKLKIIFDSLQIPTEKKNILNTWTPNDTESPLVALLSDDRLIYKFSVNTDYILQKDFFKNKEQLLILIQVKIKCNRFNIKFNDLAV